MSCSVKRQLRRDTQMRPHAVFSDECTELSGVGLSIFRLTGFTTVTGRRSAVILTEKVSPGYAQ